MVFILFVLVIVGGCVLFGQYYDSIDPPPIGSPIDPTITNMEKENVKVVVKRTNTKGRYTTTRYYITFEFEKDGSRKEFKVEGDTYGIIAEGDVGVLSFRGQKFIEFHRKIDKITK